jgi:hypothetical protein
VLAQYNELLGKKKVEEEREALFEALGGAYVPALPSIDRPMVAMSCHGIPP